MKQISILLLVNLLLIGCSKDDATTDDNNSIKLSCYSVHFWAGEECTIDVLSKADDLSLSEENLDIASGWWADNGKTIRIKGESVGTTSVYIKDREHPDRKAEIKVISDYFSGSFKEDGDKATIIVRANDESVQEQIKNDLKAIAKSRSGTLYSFDKDSKTVIVNESGGNKYTGSYEWNKDNLTIKVNETINKYGFGTIDHDSVVIRPDLDLLNTYKLKYPDTPIYDVRLVLFLGSSSRRR
nr:hypothetical protein [uncultured Bacteroides sp.]